jgi:hypothetical protein
MSEYATVVNAIYRLARSAAGGGDQGPADQAPDAPPQTAITDHCSRRMNRPIIHAE